MTFRSLIVGVCLGALAASAAGSVEPLREHASAARDTVARLRSEQLAKRSELSQLSTRIEALKAHGRRGVLPGGELVDALKRSQELSSALSSLAQRMAVSENELAASNTALLEGLSRELTRTRAEFDARADRPGRQALIARMKQLRLEREAVRASLPVTAVPALEPLKQSDDPEELLEQAELLRDNEEKLTKELKLVETRLAERVEEQELDRSVQRFMGEESMFDDQDRRLRLQSTTFKTLSLTPTQQAASNEQPPVVGAAGTPEAFTDSASRSGGSVDDSSLRVTSASDPRPLVGAARSLAEGNPDDVASLKAQRASLQQRVERLKAKARTLEQRAAELK